MNSFQKNYGMSLSIEELNLSNNVFGHEGSESLKKWISDIKGYSKLKYLYFSNCELFLHFLSDLKSLNHLIELDISGNKIDGCDGYRNIADAIEFRFFMKNIFISYKHFFLVLL